MSGQITHTAGDHCNALASGDYVPGFEASASVGVGVPSSTPAEIIDRLNNEINAMLADPKMKVRLADLGGVPLPITPADFAKIVADETEKWGKVIRGQHQGGLCCDAHLESEKRHWSPRGVIFRLRAPWPAATGLDSITDTV
jgi:Tripartite tricarboxylate transporter family receptor